MFVRYIYIYIKLFIDTNVNKIFSHWHFMWMKFSSDWFMDWSWKLSLLLGGEYSQIRLVMRMCFSYKSFVATWSNKVSSGLIIVVFIQPEIPHILKDNLSLSFSLLLVFLDSLIFINTVHELTFLASFLVNDFLKSCSAGRSTLKVLIATSLKFPSITLNIS